MTDHAWDFNSDSYEGLVKVVFSGIRLTGTVACLAFMILSFYFLSYDNLDQNHLLKRIKRLVIPYWGWAVISFIFLNILGAVVSGRMSITLLDLLIQCIFGHEFNRVFWFQFDLIILTLIMYALTHVLKGKFKFILILLLVGSLIFQYLGLNYQIFHNLPSFSRYPLGRLCEMLPCASLGALLKICGLNINNRKAKLFGIGCCGLIACLLAKYFLDTPQLYGFGYMGIIPFGISISLCFLFFGLDIRNNYIKRYIDFFSKVTMGVYCVHILVISFFSELGLNNIIISRSSLLFSVIVFLCSQGLCLLVYYLPLKNGKYKDFLRALVS